jgi:hypothetical protein
MGMRVGFLFFYFALVFSGRSQVIYSLAKNSLPKELPESSGLAVYNNFVYSHNDGGNPASLYCLDKKANLIKEIKIIGASNVDWEDMSFDQGLFYISETGNNYHNRKNLKIYTVQDSVVIKTNTFNYAKQQLFPPHESKRDFDCEALLVRNDTAYLFSKTWANPYHGITYQYILPLKNETESTVWPVDSFITGKQNFMDGSITGCDLSPGKKYFALTSCNYLYVFYNFKGCNYLQGNYAVFRYESTTQREAIAFETDSTFFVTDERWANLLGGKMYYFNLAPLLNGKIPYTIPEVNSFRIKKKGSKFNIETKYALATDTLEFAIFNNDNHPVQTGVLLKASAINYECKLNDVSAAAAYIQLFHNKKLILCRRW